MPAGNGFSADQVRAELDSVLASPAFTRSPRLGRLLTYLCTKALAGEGDQIKEYTIGVDVMDRPSSFNPTEDAIARVEIHRLRKRLREYYQQQGVADPLQIVVPNGQYVPEFHAAAAEAPPQAPPPRPRPRRWVLWVVAAALAAVIVGLFILAGLRPRPAARVAAPPSRAEKAAAGVSGAVRLACGRTQAHVDRLGREWSADRYFEGGNSVEQPRRFIARAFDGRLFDSARAGDFSYHIPLAPGAYELLLYFVETVYGPGAPGGGGEISRLFDVHANGRPILTSFDIVADAGDPFVADVRAFKNISPAPDGKLHLRFRSRRELARLSAIEIVPARPNLANPLRLYFDDGPFTDSEGRVWMPASYVTGGQLSRHNLQVAGAKDPELYAVERFGRFSFALPADSGTYALSLHFVEEFVGAGNPSGGGGVGTREFDVFCNGVALARSFDIYKEAGMNRLLVKTFHGLKPNSQGKLVVEFVPVHDYASLYALELVDETR
jgi:hypothetical protein